MALLHKIIRTSIYIVEEDKNFIRTLKHLFARSIENYKVTSFPNAETLQNHLIYYKTAKLQRNVLILPFNAQIKNRGISECIELLSQNLINPSVILVYKNGEINNDELKKYRAESFVEDIIIKDNYARLNIQNTVRRIVSYNNFIIRKKLLIASGIVSLFFLTTSLILFLQITF